MKIKVNVGCSSKRDSVEHEIQKIDYALSRHVDYISEISLIPEMKSLILDYISRQDHKNTRFCTVPFYDFVLTKKPLIEIIKDQYSKGITCFTLHMTPKHLMKRALDDGFVINSRAGNFLFSMAKAGLENPHFEAFQEIMSFIREKKCELFIGTSLRPGRVVESVKSSLWVEEIFFINNYMKEQNVNSSEFILECGGHLDTSVLNKYISAIELNQICVMGPLLTDATNGHDDFSSIIGSTLLHSQKKIHTHLLLTRDEHIRLPTVEALKDGVDLVSILRHNINLFNQDHDAISHEAKYRNQSNQCTIGINLFGPLDADPEICTMCGHHCPLRNIKYPTMGLTNVLGKRRKAKQW